MAFVLITHPPSREMYEKVAASLDRDQSADGLIVHTASEHDGRVWVVDIWESKEQAERWERDTLRPAIEAAMGRSAPPDMPDSERFETFDIMRGA